MLSDERYFDDEQEPDDPQSGVIGFLAAVILWLLVMALMIGLAKAIC